MSLKARTGRTGNVTNWALGPVNAAPRPSLYDNAVFFFLSFICFCFPATGPVIAVNGAKRFSSINVGVVFHPFIYGEVYFIRVFVLCFSLACVGGSAVRYVFPLFRVMQYNRFLPLARCVSPRPYKKNGRPFPSYYLWRWTTDG